MLILTGEFKGHTIDQEEDGGVTVVVNHELADEQSDLEEEEELSAKGACTNMKTTLSSVVVRVSKAVYKEALPVFYAGNSFIIKSRHRTRFIASSPPFDNASSSNN